MTRVFLAIALILTFTSAHAQVENPPPVVWQQLSHDCGAAACVWLLMHQGAPYAHPRDVHRHVFGLADDMGVTPLELAEKCQLFGAIITVEQGVTWEALTETVNAGRPAIVSVQVYGVWHSTVLIACWESACEARDSYYGNVVYRRDEIEWGWTHNGATVLYG